MRDLTWLGTPPYTMGPPKTRQVRWFRSRVWPRWFGGLLWMIGIVTDYNFTSRGAHTLHSDFYLVNIKIPNFSGRLRVATIRPGSCHGGSNASLALPGQNIIWQKFLLWIEKNFKTRFMETRFACSNYKSCMFSMASELFILYSASGKILIGHLRSHQRKHPKRSLWAHPASRAVTPARSRASRRGFCESEADRPLQSW